MSTYVYAFTRASHPLPLDGVAGVGEQPRPLRVLRHDGLSAVVSDAPERLRAKRRDLEAHAAVLEALGAAGTVLPMRFGAVARDDGAVKTELSSRARQYSELLSRLDGKVELNVKAAHKEEAILRALLLDHRELRERNQALRAAGGGSYEDQVALGEAVAAALGERRSEDAESVVAALLPHAADVRLGPLVDGCFVNASFLVDRAARADFEAALARLGERLTELIELRLYGPLPPYSFVASNEAAGGGI